MRRKTTSEFIKDSKKIHGDKYDYSLVEYVNNATKVKIICPEHGEFEKVAYHHSTPKKGLGCGRCASHQSRISQTFTTEQFVEKARELHGDKYDYSLVQYVNNKYKVKIICQEHGVFEQIANDHLRSKGCRKCFLNKSRGTTEQFIEKAKKVHGDRFDYSLVEYIGTLNKVKIICPEHGEFEQQPNNHCQGQGCKKCNSVNRTNTTEQFIEKAKKVHGDKFDYSFVEYIHSHAKVKIVCPEHGEFEQTSANHLTGYGCENCSYLHKKGWRFSEWYDGANKSKRFDSFKVYFVKCYDEDEVFYKIGITYTKISTRFVPSKLPYQYEIINVKEIKDINDREGARIIYDMEKRFKRFHKSNKYLPKKEFGGMFECFSSPDGPLDGPALS